MEIVEEWPALASVVATYHVELGEGDTVGLKCLNHSVNGPPHFCVGVNLQDTSSTGSSSAAAAGSCPQALVSSTE